MGSVPTFFVQMPTRSNKASDCSSQPCGSSCLLLLHDYLINTDNLQIRLAWCCVCLTKNNHYDNTEQGKFWRSPFSYHQICKGIIRSRRVHEISWRPSGRRITWSAGRPLWVISIKYRFLSNLFEIICRDLQKLLPFLEEIKPVQKR